MEHGHGVHEVIELKSSGEPKSERSRQSDQDTIEGVITFRIDG
jgi:hypothetical protein